MKHTYGNRAGDPWVGIIVSLFVLLLMVAGIIV